MKKSVSPSWLWILALLCVGCTPAGNTATPSPAAEDSDPQPVTFEGSDDAASVEFSADSMTLASGNRDKTVSLWDVSTRQESARLTGHRFPAVSLAFSPDGTLLAWPNSAPGEPIGLWDLTRLKPVVSR